MNLQKLHEELQKPALSEEQLRALRQPLSPETVRGLQRQVDEMEQRVQALVEQHREPLRQIAGNIAESMRHIRL